MRKAWIVAALLLMPGLAGCVRTAANVVTFPVRATGKVIDWTTTSQSEADRNYGRKMRKQEEREGRERRAWEKHCRKQPDAPDCQGGYPGYRAGQ